MVDSDDPDSLKPLVDGGTEGFRGQSRVILPTVSSCYECSLDMFNKPTVFPICTIANTPRLPEHCIEWASVLEWPRVFGDSKKLDNDDPEHIGWLYDVASKRAQEYNIEGVTWSLTQGVVKNIIPAIASTNAIVAASCVNEALKIVTSAGPYLDNYMMVVGTEGVYSYTFQHQRKGECPVCGGETVDLEVSREMTVQELIELLTEKQTMLVLFPSTHLIPELIRSFFDSQIKKPSLATSKTSIYLQAPPVLEQATRPNLEKTVSELVAHGEEVVVTASTLPLKLSLRILFTQ